MEPDIEFGPFIGEVNGVRFHEDGIIDQDLRISGLCA